MANDVIDGEIKKEEGPLEAEFPSKDYEHKEYGISRVELTKLITLDTISQQGKMADLMINNLINGEIFERVNQKRSPDVRAVYDISTGKIFVAEPRNWCDACHQRKAIYEVDKSKYCETCYPVVLEKRKFDKEQKEKENVKN